MNNQSDTKNIAVLLMLFNRPSTTRKVFDKLRETKPSKIFIAANGPRPDHPNDIRLCKEVRDIFNEIDWKCEVHTNYREVNINMHSHWWMAMNWLFEKVDRGIILEDDCVPDNSFFDYCIELLERYKDDEKMMHINGSNFQFGKKRGNVSYYFSKYPHVWGWATWKRAWNKYDYSMDSFPNFKEKKIIESLFLDTVQQRYWLNFLDKAYLRIFPTADIRWTYAVWSNQGICITPNVNMISNIGYGLDAGHTFLKDKTLGQNTSGISSIVHPEEIIVDKKADSFTFKQVYYKNFFQKVFYVIVIKIVKLLRH